MSEKIAYVPGRIKSAVKGGHVAGVEDIIDDALGKEQSVINQEVAEDVSRVEQKVDDIGDAIQFDEDGDLVTVDGADFSDPDARAKIPTIGAIKDGADTLGIVYDVSAKNPTAGPNNDGKFTLEYILNQNNVNTLIPTSVRKGGMSIKFVQSSEYVQYRLMATSFSTSESDWQSEDIKVSQNTNTIEEWQPNTYYVVGMQRKANSSDYRCVTSHLSGETFDAQDGWALIDYGFLHFIQSITIGNEKSFLNKCLVLKYFASTTEVNIQNIQIGENWYVTSQHRIVQRIADSGDNQWINIPYLDDTVYIFENKLYVWNGADLIQVSDKDVDYPIDFKQYNKTFGWPKSDGTRETGNEGALHYSIPVFGANKISVTSGNNVAVVTFATSIYNDGGWLKCNNTTRYLINAGETQVIDIPYEAEYIIVGARASTGDEDMYTPKSLLLKSASSNLIIEKIISDDKTEQQRIDALLYNNTLNSTKDERIRNTGATVYVNSFYTSSYKRLNGEKLVVKNVTASPDEAFGAAAVAFYDINKKFISAYVSESTGLQNVEVEPADFPQNAVYIRCNYQPVQGDIDFVSGVYPMWYDAPNEAKPQIIQFNSNCRQMIAAISRTPRSGAATYEKPLVLAHFSDVHLVNTVETDRIMQFVNYFPYNIDDALCTGDVNQESNANPNYWRGGSIQNVLFCVGNHDAYADSTHQTLVAASVVYDKFFAPNISTWNITNHPTGKTYYYKDYLTQKIRLIVLDCMYWDSDQNTWLQNALSDAITNNMRVICADHYPAAAFTPIICNFDDSHLQGLAAVRYIDSAAVNNVKDFIDNNGEFICWLTGHEHCDYMGTLNDDPRQLMIGIDRGSNRDDWYSATPRVINDKSQDLFNIYGFDVYNKQIRLYRVGADRDMYMRVKDTFCINYETKSIISDN